MGTDRPLQLEVDGQQVEVPDDGASLMEVLRHRLGIVSVKDGCSPQGQCGCCTVLVDGQPRVSCVTPARRVAGRRVTTLDGLEAADRAAWGERFCATGASQCGFCTPGIIMRLAGLRSKGVAVDDTGAVERALAAHLCRCTGWVSILEAWRPSSGAEPGRDLAAAARRAEIEGGVGQRVGPHIALGAGGFADDSAPPDALVAVSDGADGWVVAETLTEARRAAAKVQGRRSGAAVRPPLALPAGDWSATVRTTWVEPAYLETDASWCEPGGPPADPVANGGAFGGKLRTAAPAIARQLADRHGRAVRVLFSREDTVRLGPKRPPVAAGIRADGTGIMHIARTPGAAERVAVVAPGLEVREVDVVGPPTSLDLRAAGWAEAMVLLSAIAEDNGPIHIRNPFGGADAWAEVTADGRIVVRVECGQPLDEVVLRSYCTGAAHMGYGWVTSEGLAIDDDGQPADLTVRSFDVLAAARTPPIEVTVEPGDGPPTNGSDAVFVAVAAATWRAAGRPTDWPIEALPR